MTLIEFRKYIKEMLGWPIINIEITDNQLDNAINNAVQLFYENHYDGVNLGYVSLPITSGTTSYTLDSHIHDVIKILSNDNFNYSNDPLLIKESLQFGSCLSSHYDLISLEIWKQNLQNLQNVYNKEILFDFNSISKQLVLHIEPEADTTYMLRVYQSELDLADVYNDIWLKNYAVALSKKQWGSNLGKYSGAQMPGGSEFNYSDIISEAKEEINELKEELEDKYSEPADWEIA